MLNDLTKIELVERKLDIENARLNLINFSRRIENTHNYMSLTHTHAFTEIFACLSGEVTLHTISGNIKLQSGDIALFPPTNLHTMDSTEETRSAEKYSLGITVKEIQSNGATNLFHKFYDVIYDRGISVYRNLPDFAKIIKDFYLNDGHDELLILPYFLNTLHKTKCELFSSRQQQSDPAGEDMERLVLIEEIINNNYLSEISSESLAQMLFISRRQLDRTISAHFNKTFRDLIIEKRIRYGAELLRSTDKTIEEISILAAFPSTRSFSNEFIKEYGTPPGKYRKINFKHTEIKK